jgi:hypothetical protein
MGCCGLWAKAPTTRFILNGAVGLSTMAGLCLRTSGGIGLRHRNIEAAPEDRKNILGKDYENGATVWSVEAYGTVCYSRTGRSNQVRARFVVVATGAMERPVPIPGWTLPGVMGAAAAGTLAKEPGKEGVHELNEIKIMTRCGMGTCQGRMCGPSLAELIAAETGLPPDKTGLLNIRPPLKPIPLEEIAQLALDDDLEENTNWLVK